MDQVGIAPARSHEQRMRALERANEIRTRRRILKEEMKRGERTLLEVLADPGAELASMKFRDLLLAVPKVGQVKTDKTLRLARISPSKTLGGLTERQRRELVAFLPGSAVVS